jgi:hypothetical protein
MPKRKIKNHQKNKNLTPAPMVDRCLLEMGAIAIVALVVIGLVFILILRKR